MQLDLGNEVMKKFRLKKKTLNTGFEEKMNRIFNDYYDWYFDPSKNNPFLILNIAKNIVKFVHV